MRVFYTLMAVVFWDLIYSHSISPQTLRFYFFFTIPVCFLSFSSIIECKQINKCLDVFPHPPQSTWVVCQAKLKHIFHSKLKHSRCCYETLEWLWMKPTSFYLALLCFLSNTTRSKGELPSKGRTCTIPTMCCVFRLYNCAMCTFIYM